MRTAAACAGEVRTIVEAAEQTAATVSAASRVEDVLGKGFPPGTWQCVGTRVERRTGAGATGGGGGGARRSR
ncbi:hypothetical protein GCM10010389_62350 [Streptomyces echinoruber]|uniref:Uncharacterized protein n=1 Tax=Streptomyces echinoruber TaxID=68898 RepID=A0A918RXM6_9ACTN|nr:hypothetical protein GCM10010389_62350 [Streptomyces echinoruber]